MPAGLLARGSTARGMAAGLRARGSTARGMAAGLLARESTGGRYARGASRTRGDRRAAWPRGFSHAGRPGAAWPRGFSHAGRPACSMPSRHPEAMRPRLMMPPGLPARGRVALRAPCGHASRRCAGTCMRVSHPCAHARAGRQPLGACRSPLASHHGSIDPIRDRVDPRAHSPQGIRAAGRQPSRCPDRILDVGRIARGMPRGLP